MKCLLKHNIARIVMFWGFISVTPHKILWVLVTLIFCLRKLRRREKSLLKIMQLMRHRAGVHVWLQVRALCTLTFFPRAFVSMAPSRTKGASLPMFAGHQAACTEPLHFSTRTTRGRSEKLKILLLFLGALGETDKRG